MNSKNTCILLVAIACQLCLIQCQPAKSKIEQTKKTQSNKMPNTKNDNETKSDTAMVDSNIVEQSIKEDTLTIQISKLKNIASTLNISIYGIDNEFPSTTDILKTYSFSIHGSTYSAKLQGIKHGTYAIAMFQDENNSGQINKNFLGIPTERYGFSQNIVPKFKAPSFDDCKFNFNSESTVIHIQMIP